MPGLFVTATGTDIGKTFVTAGLIRAGRRAGAAVSALKPIMSGYEEADAAQSDACVLLAALEREVTAETIAAISPWRFAAPLSPDMAAEAEGRHIDFAEVVATCRGSVDDDCVTFIEGVGGVMVPLDGRYTVLDLMAALDLPVLLVTGTYLGAISHVLTAAAALSTAGLRPALFILNETVGSRVPSAAMEQTLRSFYPATGVSIVPRDAPDTVFDTIFAQIQAISAPSRNGGSAA